MNFRVDFENDGKAATAPAQNVIILLIKNGHYCFGPFFSISFINAPTQYKPAEDKANTPGRCKKINPALNRNLSSF